MSAYGYIYVCICVRWIMKLQLLQRRRRIVVVDHQLAPRRQQRRACRGRHCREPRRPTSRQRRRPCWARVSARSVLCLASLRRPPSANPSSRPNYRISISHSRCHRHHRFFPWLRPLSSTAASSTPLITKAMLILILMRFLPSGRDLHPNASLANPMR